MNDQQHNLQVAQPLKADFSKYWGSLWACDERKLEVFLEIVTQTP
jgi:hypothetical protein